MKSSAKEGISAQHSIADIGSDSTSGDRSVCIRFFDFGTHCFATRFGEEPLLADHIYANTRKRLRTSPRHVPVDLAYGNHVRLHPVIHHRASIQFHGRPLLHLRLCIRVVPLYLGSTRAHPRTGIHVIAIVLWHALVW